MMFAGRWKWLLAAGVWCASAGLALAQTLAQTLTDKPAQCTRAEDGTRRVVDMSGRTVVLPVQVRSVATVGSVPVINGYLYALGAGERIANALPSRFTASGRWTLLGRIAPHLADKPVLQGQTTSEVSLENLLRLAPDVVVTMDLMRVRMLETARIPVVYLEWGSASDIHTNMRVLGCALDLAEQGEAYLRYFDEVMARVREAVGTLPEAQRPAALYFNPHTMSTPLQIANWWIAEAGGRSVTAELPAAGNTQYSHERLLLWNPDVLFVSAPEQMQAVYGDERFAKLAAVRKQQVFVTPMGAHSWGQRTVEQPLTVLWAATMLHPEQFSLAALQDEVRHFYRRFFGYELSDAELQAVLEGRAS